ncbi:TPA: hypothetical protein SOK86_003037 [Clostridioides difficile]|nr:hypothetical protein [Clostridioides difficile]HEK4719380.1 hypothetical protein [Clostridioides difficile]HEK8838611.1 hypothetical protein [Clostridioides difficile]
MDSDKIFSKDKLKVHMFYIIVVLILTLVVVITDRGYDNNDLSQWIAFGATLSGIILSVLAIILTLIGESKSDNTKDTFLNISKDLENIVDNVRKEFINVSTELENIKSEFLNTSEALDNVVYNVKHATKLFEEAKLDNKKIFQKFIDMQTNSKNTYCSEKEEENFNSLDYIGIYKKFVEKFDGDEYKYTLIMFYFFWSSS